MSRMFSKSVLIVAGLVCTVTGCTSTTATKTTVGSVENVTTSSFPSFTAPTRSVAPDLAQACINSAANKYFLPTRVIKAVDSRKPGDGSTQVILKVDLRDAVCTVSASGVVKSVIDTSPKSADQIAAEAQAAAAKNDSQTTADNSITKTTGTDSRKAAAAGQEKNGVKKRAKTSKAADQTLY